MNRQNNARRFLMRGSDAKTNTPRPRKSKRNSNKSNKKNQNKGRSVSKEPSLRNYRSTRTNKTSTPNNTRNKDKSKKNIGTNQKGGNVISRSKSREANLTYGMRNQKKQEFEGKKKTYKKRDKSVNKRNKSEKKNPKRTKSMKKGIGSNKGSKKQISRPGMRTFRRNNSGKIASRGYNPNYNTPNSYSSNPKGYSSKKSKTATSKQNSANKNGSLPVRNRFANRKPKTNTKNQRSGLPVKNKYNNHRNNFKPKNQKKKNIVELSRISEVTQERQTVFDSIEGTLTPKKNSLLVNHIIKQQSRGPGVVQSTNQLKPKGNMLKNSLTLKQLPSKAENQAFQFPKTWANPMYGLLQRKLEKVNPLDLNKLQVEINPKFDKAAWDLKLKELMQGYIEKNKKQLEEQKKKSKEIESFQEQAGQLGVQNISNLGKLSGVLRSKNFPSLNNKSGSNLLPMIGNRIRNKTAPLRTNSEIRNKTFENPQLMRTSTPNPLKTSWKAQNPRAMIQPLHKMGNYIQKKIANRSQNSSLSLSKNKLKIPATSTSFGKNNIINKIEEEPDEEEKSLANSTKSPSTPLMGSVTPPVKLISHSKSKSSIQKEIKIKNQDSFFKRKASEDSNKKDFSAKNQQNEAIRANQQETTEDIKKTMENVPTVKNLQRLKRKSKPNQNIPEKPQIISNQLTSVDPGRHANQKIIEPPTAMNIQPTGPLNSFNAPTINLKPQFINTQSNFSGNNFSVLSSINSIFKNDINPSLRKIIEGKWKDMSGTQNLSAVAKTPLTESQLKGILKTPESMMRINNSFLFSEIRRLENEIKQEKLKTMLETNLQRLKNSNSKIKSLDDSHVAYGRSKVRQNLNSISQIFERIQVQESLLKDQEFLNTMKLSQGDPNRILFSQQKLGELLSKGTRTFGTSHNSYLKDLLSDARSKLTGNRNSFNMTARPSQNMKKKFNMTTDMTSVGNSNNASRKTVSTRIMDVKPNNPYSKPIIEVHPDAENDFGVRETQRAGFRVIHEDSVGADWQISKKIKESSKEPTPDTSNVGSSGNQILNSKTSASDTKGYMNSSLLDKTDMQAEKDSMVTYALGSVAGSLAPGRTQYLNTHEKVPIPQPEMPLEIESSSHELNSSPADINHILNNPPTNDSDMNRLNQMIKDIEHSTPKVPNGPGESQALRALVRENAEEFNTNVSDVMNITQGALKGFDSKYGNGAEEMINMMESDEKVQFDSQGNWESNNNWNEVNEQEKLEAVKSRLQASIAGLARHENSINNFDSMMKTMITSTHDARNIGKLGIENSNVTDFKNPLDASLAFLKRNPLSSMENSMVGQMRWKDSNTSGLSAFNALKFGTNTSDHLQQILKDNNLGNNPSPYQSSGGLMDKDDSFAVLMGHSPSFMQSGKNSKNETNSNSASKYDSQSNGAMAESNYHATFIKKDEPAIGTEFLEDENSDQDSMESNDGPTRAIKDETLAGVDVVYPETQSGPYKLTNSSINFGKNGDVDGSGESEEEEEMSEYRGNTDEEYTDTDEYKQNEETNNSEGTGNASFAFQSKVIHNKVIRHNQFGLGSIGGTKISSDQTPTGLLSRIDSDGPDSNKQTIINKFPLSKIPKTTDSYTTQKEDKNLGIPVKLTKENLSQLANPQNKRETSFVLDTTPFYTNKTPAQELPKVSKKKTEIIDQETKHKMQGLELKFYQFKTGLDQFKRRVKDPSFSNWLTKKVMQFLTIQTTVDSIIKALSKSLSREKSKLKMLELKIDSTEQSAKIYEQKTEQLQIELDAWEEQFGAMFEFFRLYIYSKNKQDLGEGLMLVENQIAALKDFFFFKLNRYTIKEKEDMQRAMTIEEKKYYEKDNKKHNIWENDPNQNMDQLVPNEQKLPRTSAFQKAKNPEISQTNVSNPPGVVSSKKLTEQEVGLRVLLTETDLGNFDYSRSHGNIQDLSLAQDLVPNYNFNKNQKTISKNSDREINDLHNMSNMLNNYKMLSDHQSNGQEFRNTSILDQILKPNFLGNKDQTTFPNTQLNETLGEFGVINSMIKGNEQLSFFGNLTNANFQGTSFFNSIVQAHNFQSGRHELGELKLSNIKDMNDQKAGSRIASFKEQFDEIGGPSGNRNYIINEPNFPTAVEDEAPVSPEQRSQKTDDLEESIVKSKEISSLKVIAENNRKRSLREIEKRVQMNENENQDLANEYSTNGDNMVNMSEMRPGFEFNFPRQETGKFDQEKAEDNNRKEHENSFEYKGIDDDDDQVNVDDNILNFSGYDSYKEEDDSPNIDSIENHDNIYGKARNHLESNLRIDLQKQPVYDSGYNQQLENILGQPNSPNAPNPMLVNDSTAVVIGNDTLDQPTENNYLRESQPNPVNPQNTPLNQLKDPNRQIFETEQYMEPENSFNQFMQYNDINWEKAEKRNDFEEPEHTDFNKKMDKLLGMPEKIDEVSYRPQNESNLDDLINEIEGKTEKDFPLDTYNEESFKERPQDIYEEHQKLRNDFLTQEEQNNMLYSIPKLDMKNKKQKTKKKKEEENYYYENDEDNYPIDEYDSIKRDSYKSDRQRNNEYNTAKDQTSHITQTEQTEGQVEVGDSLQGLPSHKGLLMELERYHTEHVREKPEIESNKNFRQKKRDLERYKTEITYTPKSNRPPQFSRGRRAKKNADKVVMSQTLKESSTTNDFIDGNEMGRNLKLALSSSMDGRSSGLPKKRSKMNNKDEKKNKKNRKKKTKKKEKRNSNYHLDLKTKISESHFGKKSTAQEIEELASEFSKNDLSQVSSIVKRDLSKRMSKRTKTLGNLKQYDKAKESKRFSGNPKQISARGKDLKRINEMAGNRTPKALYHKKDTNERKNRRNTEKSPKRPKTKRSRSRRNKSKKNKSEKKNRSRRGSKRKSKKEKFMQKYASKKSNRFVEKKSIVVPKNSGIREAFYEVNLDAKKFTRNKRTKERKYDISNSNLQFSAFNSNRGSRVGERENRKGRLMKDEMTKDFNATMMERIKESAVYQDKKKREEEMMREFFTERQTTPRGTNRSRPSQTSNSKFRSNRPN